MDYDYTQIDHWKNGQAMPIQAMVYYYSQPFM